MAHPVWLQMLLLLKTNDCLRHIDRELGSPINSSLIAAEECARALLREEMRKGEYASVSYR